MSIRTCIAILALVLLSLDGLAHAENWLQGQVLENHGSSKKPAVGAQVWIVNVGNPYMTLSDGGYRVLVPDAYRVGQTIVLYVKRKGWAIATPVGGKVELKKDFTGDIVLSPDTSPEFLLPAQLDKLLESLPEKLQSQVKPDGKEGSADPAQVLKEYASDHGIAEQEVRVKVEELVKQYEQSSDLGKQCLAAIYRKDLRQAAILCKQSATSKVDLLKNKRQEIETLSKSHLKSDRSVEPSFAYGFGEIIRVTGPITRLRSEAGSIGSHDALFVEALSRKSTPAQLEEAKRQLIKLTEEVVGEFKSTGDTYYANYQFDKALETYKEGLNYTEKKDIPTLWADMQRRMGIAHSQIGIRTKDASIREHLSQAVKRFGEAQTVYAKTEFPEAWAAIESNLGSVFLNQGTRTEGEAGTQLLSQAVAAYREALTVYTKEALPQDWAGVQNNLGLVLREQGMRTFGEAGTKLLAQAVAAYREALTVYTKEHLPQDWAMTQNNLGTVLWSQGALTGDEAGIRLLAQAVEAFQAALMVYTKKTYPQNWGMTQNNLGLVLGVQGVFAGGEAGTQLLAQAIDALHAALTVRTKETLPQDWAATQNNLGLALYMQDWLTGGATGTQLLAQAVNAYQAALTVRTKETLPQDWAATQTNLGIVLHEQGIREGGKEGRKLLRQAIAAYQLALQVRTKDTLSRQWEQTMDKLQKAEKALADIQ